MKALRRLLGKVGKKESAERWSQAPEAEFPDVSGPRP